jgi:hypothetical protein
LNMGKTVEFKPDELFFKFIKEYLCWFEKDYGKDYKLVSVSGGVFQTALLTKMDELKTPPASGPTLLHPAIDLLRKELTPFIQSEFTTDGLHVLTFSSFKRVFHAIHLFP